jgi:hypothetical protein
LQLIEPCRGPEVRPLDEIGAELPGRRFGRGRSVRRRKIHEIGVEIGRCAPDGLFPRLLPGTADPLSRQARPHDEIVAESGFRGFLILVGGITTGARFRPALGKGCPISRDSVFAQTTQVPFVPRIFRFHRRVRVFKGWKKALPGAFKAEPFRQ